MDTSDVSIAEQLIDIKKGADLLAKYSSQFGDTSKRMHKIAGPMYEEYSDMIDDGLIIAAAFIAQRMADKNRGKHSMHAAANALAQAANVLVLYEQLVAIEDSILSNAAERGMPIKTARLIAHTMASRKTSDTISALIDNTRLTLADCMAEFVRSI